MNQNYKNKEVKIESTAAEFTRIERICTDSNETKTIIAGSPPETRGDDNSESVFTQDVELKNLSQNYKNQ